MNRLLLAASAALVTTLLTAASAQACGFLDFGCNAAKKKAEKTQVVISIIDAGRKSGWKNVRKEFSNREIAEMRRLGLDPTNRGLINALKGVNDEHFEDLSDDSWNGVVDMIGTEEYVDKQIAKAKLGVDDLDKLQREYDKVIENEAEFQAALTIEEQQAKQAELLQKIEEKRETLISSVDNLHSQLELSVLSGAIGSAARTLDEAGVNVARSIMEGNDFDDMVSRAAAKVGMTQDAAREVLQQAVSFGVSEIAHQSLTRTDGIAEAGNQAAAAGDYAAAAAADASARAQAAADRAAEAAALEAAGLTEEAAKVAELAQAEAELAAEAAEYATQVATQEAQAAAEKAAVEAHHAAVEATAAAESAAAKASFIAQAMADGATQAEAEQLAADAGH